LPAEDILAGVDCYLVTHIHPDHIDMAPDGTVGAPLDKSVPVFVQNTEDAEAFKRSGFRHVEVLKENGFGEAHLTKTPARHGVIKPCGDACGVVLQCAGEKTLYIAGDTVWYDGVEKTLASQNPDIVILNACAAELEGYGRLIMGDEDVEAVSVTAPDAQIVLTHMDNVAHASITRHEMRAKLYRRGIKNYLMPQDGESLML